ncbi:MAG: hypothetical protein J6T10_08420 [Methanobrevibacter sp.]|nr:hypothetical protein [Methanobrevibacter sp.]
MKRKRNSNYKFIDSMEKNEATYNDYLYRFRRIALSMFEWVNLPQGMNARYLEECLYYNGKAALLKDEKYGFINTKCAGTGYVNIYGLPTRLNCYSYSFNSQRTLYTGLNPINTEEERIDRENEECILVQNNWECLPTVSSMELFAYRLYEAQVTCDTNIIAQKTPVLLVADETQRLFLENLYNQYNGNQPFIFGDKQQLGEQTLKAINTEAPYVADKITEYKKEIWNEALTFLGVNNIMLEKKERLVTDEANSNNELINLNLQSFLAPRQEACKQFNEKYGFTGTDKEISVRVRSDLYNIIKKEMSTTSEFINKKEVEINE